MSGVSSTASSAKRSRRISPVEEASVRAVDREDDALGDVLGQLSPKLFELHEGVLLRQRDGAVEVHDGVLLELVEGELRGEKRPESVSVRVLVGGQEEPLVRPDRVSDPAQLLLRLVRMRAHREAWRAGLPGDRKSTRLNSS